MKRTFAIGDIHGCLRTLNALLDKIAFSSNDQIVFLGDYVDRGPNSKGVIDSIVTLMHEGYDVEMLCGNHEQMLISDHIEAQEFESQRIGNKQMLASFGVSTAKDIPVEYPNFLATLPYFKCVDNYILVHGGLNFIGHDPLSHLDDMLWIRDWYDQIDFQWLGNRMIVHGHTPQTTRETNEQLKNLHKLPVLDIDCGAYMRNRVWGGFGHLCAFDLTNQVLHFQENIDFDCVY